MHFVNWTTYIHVATCICKERNAFCSLMAKHLLTFTLDDSIFSVYTQGGGAMFFSTKPENIFHQFLLEKSGRTDYNFFHLSGKYIFGYITAPHLKVTCLFPKKITWLQKTTIICYWFKTTWSKIIGVRTIILLPSLCTTITNSNNKRLQRNFMCRDNIHLWTELFCWWQ